MAWIEARLINKCDPFPLPFTETTNGYFGKEPRA